MRRTTWQLIFWAGFLLLAAAVVLGLLAAWSSGDIVARYAWSAVVTAIPGFFLAGLAYDAR